jgi:pyruvate decarboxylase
VLNNGGYTVERLIHGMNASYNTVPIWDYGALFQAFGPSYKTKHHLVKTPDDLDAVLANEEFNEAAHAQVCEHFLGLEEVLLIWLDRLLS